MAVVLFWSMSGVLPRVCVATPFSLIVYSPHVVFLAALYPHIIVVLVVLS